MSAVTLVEPLSSAPESGVPAESLEAAASPWRFLRPLSADRADDRELIQISRAAELRAVTQMISSARVSILYAASGNGKSSLINAGVVPHFTKLGYIPVRTRPRPPWCVHDPAQAFKECILRNLSLPLVSDADLDNLYTLRMHVQSLSPEADKVEGQLQALEQKLRRFRINDPVNNELRQHLEARRSAPIADFVRELRTYMDSDARLLVVCDQFEEVFVHFSRTPALAKFIADLGELSSDSALKVHLLFSLREDWVGSMIEFREAIPDIFVSYYKLNPVTRSQAQQVLEVPLARYGLTWEPALLQRMLEELVRNYAYAESGRLGQPGIRPGFPDDPFLELPALQIVADRMWHSRRNQQRPFSILHYESLLPEARTGEAHQQPHSLCDWLLDNYLREQLETLDKSAASEDVLRELRLDCLYLLTDQTAHRRALEQHALLNEVNRLRPALLQLPHVDATLLTRALAPLKALRLLEEYEGVGGEPQFELAHDFAVRAVVRAWRELDRTRTIKLASQTESFEKQRVEFAAYNSLKQPTAALMIIGGLLAVSGLFGVAVAGAGGEADWLRRLIWSSGALFVGVGALALGRGERGMIKFGALGLLTVLAYTTWILLPNPPETRVRSTGNRTVAHVIPLESLPIRLTGMLDGGPAYFALSAQNGASYRFGGHVDGGDAVVEVLLDGRVVAHDDDGAGSSRDSLLNWRAQANRTVIVGIREYQSNRGGYALTVHSSRDLTGASVRTTSARELEPQSFGPQPDTESYLVWPRPLHQESAPGWFVALSGLALFMIWFQAASGVLARLDARRPAKILAIMGAEIVDGGIVVGLFVAGIAAVDSVPPGSSILQLTLMIGSAVLLLFGASAYAVTRWGRTPGLWIARQKVVDSTGAYATFQRACVRQACFLAWIVLNVVYLTPWLLIGPLYMRKQERIHNLYDRVSGLHPVASAVQVSKRSGMPAIARRVVEQSA